MYYVTLTAGIYYWNIRSIFRMYAALLRKIYFDLRVTKSCNGKYERYKRDGNPDGARSFLMRNTGHLDI